uniref:Carboxylic ester hydrolase n=1 Tax=Cupiennius salei TaxID=6928 RepID=A0AAU7E3W1_CUPSA
MKSNLLSRSNMLIINGVILFCFIQATYADRVVMTTNGPLQGITVESAGTAVEAFLGVPYAEPPVGRLRFARPVPKTSWFGVYDASRLAPTCIQNVTEPYYFTPDVTNMTEDCLYLNIWVPRFKSKAKLKPVLFFIHGGAFNIGSSNMKVYDGSKLAVEGDVIVVTVNYRVGVMGFFSAFIADADGNMGLYDQVIALTWIRDNAASFGGDPDHIVLMGQSAGAMSAAGHIMSPLTKHMVKRVILQSGAAMLPMILDENERLYKASQTMATLVGCADKTVTLKTHPRIIVKCMKRLPPEELSRAEGIMMSSNPITFIPRTGDDYIPKNTIQMVRDGEFADTEMLIGVTKDEGTFFITAALPHYFGVYGLNPVQTISKRLAFQMTRVMYKLLGESGSSEIAEFYVNNIENGTSDKYTKAISESIGDYMITCNAIFHSEFHSIRNNPVYFYKFSHRSSETPLANWMGTTHFDEIEFVFGNPLHGNFTEEEEAMSHRIMSRWLAFAKTGNPNIDGAVEWPLYTYNQPYYLDMSVKETVRTRPDDYRCEFWRDRYQAGIDENLVQSLQGSASRFRYTLLYLMVPLMLFILY